jgi:hypothetical protein
LQWLSHIGVCCPFIYGLGLKPRFIGGSSVAYPTFQFDADPDPTFHSDAELYPDLTFQFDADPDPVPTTHLFPDLDPPMLQNGPLRLLPFHFDADPDLDPAFTLIRIRILRFTLMRIRIQLLKMMQCGSGSAALHNL